MVKIIESILNKIRNEDRIVQPFYASLHGTNDINQKTLFGGCLSTFVKAYLFYIAISQFLRMVNLNDPHIESLEITYDNHDKRIYHNETSLTLIEIWQGGNQNPSDTFMLTHESKKYMHVNLK